MGSNMDLFRFDGIDIDDFEYLFNSFFSATRLISSSGSKSFSGDPDFQRWADPIALTSIIGSSSSESSASAGWVM